MEYAGWLKQNLSDFLLYRRKTMLDVPGQKSTNATVEPKRRLDNNMLICYDLRLCDGLLIIGTVLPFLGIATILHLTRMSLSVQVVLALSSIGSAYSHDVWPNIRAI